MSGPGGGDLTLEVDLADLEVGEMTAVAINDRRILVCHTRDGVFAIDDRCSHADAHLCEGRLRGLRVTCPLHGAAFDVRSGAVLKGPARQPVRSYPVRRDGARAWVTVPGDRAVID